MANNKSKALVKVEPRLPKLKENRQPGDLLAYSIRNYPKLLKLVDPASDFAPIPQAGKFQIEPKRELIMKVISFFELSYKVAPVSTRETYAIKKGKKVPTSIYMMEARVWDRFGNEVTEIGIANTLDGYTENREDHDAATKAATRALKRAVEGVCGMALINQIILHFFGNFTIGPAKAKELKLSVGK